LQSKTNYIAARPKSELVGKAGTIRLDGFQAHENPAGNLLAAVTPGHQDKHLPFPVAQDVCRPRWTLFRTSFPKHILDKNVSQTRVHEHSSSVYRSYGRKQFRIHAPFQHVARGAGRKYGPQIGGVIVHREDENPRFRAIPHDLLKRQDTASPGHCEVHQCHIRSGFACCPNGLLSIGSFSHNFHICLAIDKQS
jgi:hypothetical protein